MSVETGAGWHLCTSHHDPVRKELHGHTWEVVAWWPGDPPRDALVLQETLKGVLRGLDHAVLPPELASAEALAQAIGGLITGCVGVDISRPSERLYARWRP